MEKNVAYFGHEKNIRLANDDVELVLPTEYGPRVIRYAARGGPNLFGEVSPALQGNETPFGDKWHIYGGHRLWYAPEHPVRTYFPDNAPISVEAIGELAVRLTQRTEAHSHLAKTIEVRLAPTGSRVSLLHRITNHGAFDVELSPWSLSVMAKNGVAIFPHVEFVPHPEALAPARPLVLWPFTRMNDPRWRWGDRYFFLRQDPGRAEATKVGLYDKAGWMAYLLGDTLFVKRHRPAPGPHPDFGCNVETFTNDAILELETLGPATRVAPGASVLHRDEWFLFPGVALDPEGPEDRLAAALAPLLAATTMPE